MQKFEWLSGRDLDSQIREPSFESCHCCGLWTCVFTLHCSGSLCCLNEYLAIGSGGYLYEQSSHINCSVAACFP